MKEYLKIKYDQYLYRVEWDEIWYITTDHNVSLFFLTNGKHFKVRMPLYKVKEEIDKYFKGTHENFRYIGQSLIVNMYHSFMIGKKEIELVNRKADGFLVGYSAGYSDAESNNKPEAIKLKTNSVTLSIPENALIDEFPSKQEKKNKWKIM
ncbi:MAG: hypothetical protein IKQ94_07935 [Bacteroidales bacterium]|nr:hypothetical protein [Bacteroidales bacterium]